MLWLILLLIPFASLNGIMDDKANSTSICKVVLDPNSTLAQIENLNVTGIVENRSNLFDFCMEQRLNASATNNNLSSTILGQKSG